MYQFLYFFLEMELFSGFIVKAILTFIVIYVFWQLWKFATKYKEWRKITSQMTVIGPIHPFWGSLHLVSIQRKLSYPNLA